MDVSADNWFSAERSWAGVFGLRGSRASEEKSAERDQVDWEPGACERVGELRGKFLFSDRKPVASEWIKFSPTDEKRFDSVNIESDNKGHFVFKLPKGAAGQVFGEMSTYIGEFTKCPKMDSLIKATGRTNHTFKTDAVEFEGSIPNGEIELTLPFPSCVKLKE